MKKLFFALLFNFVGCASSPLFQPFAQMLQCQEAPSFSSGIIGGSQVGYGDPDQQLVSMLKVRRGQLDSICTASLISDQVLLTAAHCVIKVEPDQIYAYFQTKNGCPVNQFRPVRIKVKSIILHKDFDGTPKSFSDLALVYLSEKAPSEQRRLPLSNGNLKLTNDQILLLGYGITHENEKNSQVLRRVHKSLKADVTDKNQFLLIDQREKSSGFCRGDSGAPIIGEVWGEPYIIGVNSANIGITANTECQTASLSISTKYFYDWITRNKKLLDSSTWFSRLFSSSVIAIH